jgi:secreted trypsin-like serine protease
MKQNIIGKCLLSIACLALLACGGSDSSTANNSELPPEIRIINGTEHGAADLPQFVKVLSQNSEGQVGGCTGTAISPKVIITATHCIIEAVAVLVQIGDSLENDPVFVPEKIIYDQN